MQSFHLDKAINVIVEGLAESFIRQYWLVRGKKVNVYENTSDQLPGQRGFDRYDSFGCYWEVKNDAGAWRTKNVFIERNAYEKSKATHYLYFVHGSAYALTREQLASLIAEFEHTELSGGDGGRSIGILVPQERFREVAEEVILTTYVF